MKSFVTPVGRVVFHQLPNELDRLREAVAKYHSDATVIGVDRPTAEIFLILEVMKTRHTGSTIFDALKAARKRVLELGMLS